MKRFIFSFFALPVLGLLLFGTAAASNDMPFQLTINENAGIFTSEEPGDYLASVIDLEGNSRFFTVTVVRGNDSNNRVVLPLEIERNWWREGSYLIIQNSAKITYKRVPDRPTDEEPVLPDPPEFPEIPELPSLPNPVKPKPTPGTSDNNKHDADTSSEKKENSNKTINSKKSEPNKNIQFPQTDMENQMFYFAKYSDVSANEWYYNAVLYVTEKGMMTGNSGCFSPAEPLTRGMMAQILYNIEKSPMTSMAYFPDVKPFDWFANAVSWSFAQGVMHGYSNGNFGPNAPITREQLAAILYRYAGIKGYNVSISSALDVFSDSDIVSGWAEGSLRWAVGCGLLSGRVINNTRCLEPGKTATRAEVAQIFMNFDLMFAHNTP